MVLSVVGVGGGLAASGARALVGAEDSHENLNLCWILRQLSGWSPSSGRSRTGVRSWVGEMVHVLVDWPVVVEPLLRRRAVEEALHQVRWAQEV